MLFSQSSFYMIELGNSLSVSHSQGQKGLLVLKGIGLQAEHFLLYHKMLNLRVDEV